MKNTTAPSSTFIARETFTLNRVDAAYFDTLPTVGAVDNCDDVCRDLLARSRGARSARDVIASDRK